MADKKSRGLGRGLSALMADVAPKAEEPVSSSGVSRSDRSVPIELVFPNPDQPRRTFDEDKLDELTESIKSKGIFQPLIVRQRPLKLLQVSVVGVLHNGLNYTKYLLLLENLLIQKFLKLRL